VKDAAIEAWLEKPVCRFLPFCIGFCCILRYTAFQACRCVQGAPHRLQPSPSLDNVGFAYRCRSSARRRFPNRHAARKRLAITGSAHAMTAQRISAIQEGQLQPMFGGALEIPSPSPTLLIETHRGEAGRAYTRIIPRHVLTLFLEPAAVWHSADGASTSHIFIPANTVVMSLRGRSESVLWLDTAQVLVVEVSDRALAEAAGTLFEAQSFELMPSPGVQDARLSALLQALHAEQVSGYGSGRLFVDGIEQALAACLVSRYSTRRPKRRVRTGGLSPSRAKRLVDHIQAHIGSPLPLDELAACAGLSSSYLSRAFRETFSVTPHDFVLDMRIKRAMELLAQPGNSILDVAQLCGFQTQQHFSRIFRQRVGVSPGQFCREL